VEDERIQQLHERLQEMADNQAKKN
jgi:hypothetical protein